MLSSVLAPGLDWKFDDTPIAYCLISDNHTPEPKSLISTALPPGTFSGSVSTLASLYAPLLGVKMTDNPDHTTFGQ